MQINTNKLKKRTSKWSIAIFRLVLLGGLSFILLYPIIFMISFGFRSGADMQSPMVIWVPKTLVWDNLYNAIKLMGYGSAFKNSVLITFVSSAIQVVICALVGYGMSRFDFKIKPLLYGACIITIIVPPTIVIMPTYLYYSYFDFFGIGSLMKMITGVGFSVSLTDSVFLFYLLALVGMGIRSGLFILIFTQFFRGMAKELEEAAYIDGCGTLKTFVRIFAPNAAPAFLTVFLFSVVWYWNDYFFAATYVPKLETVSVALSTLATVTEGMIYGGTIDRLEVSTIMQAGCLLLVLPMLIMYVFLQKYFTQSIEKTGIVG